MFYISIVLIVYWTVTLVSGSNFTYENSSTVTRQDSHCPFGCDCRTPGVVIIIGGLLQRIPILPINTTKLHYDSASESILKDDMFVSKNCDSVRELNLQTNGIKQIESRTFYPFSQLRCLQLKENSLEELNSELFINNPQLQTLDLSQNLFNFIPMKALCTLNNLEVLYLGQNPWLDITWDDPCLEQLIHLRSINFHDSHLRYLLHNNTFLGLRNLSIEYLNLISCGITVLPALLFQHFPKLKTLILESNNIRIISEPTLTPLSNLEIFRFSNNHVKVFDIEMLTQAANLREFGIGYFVVVVTKDNIEQLAAHPYIVTMNITEGIMLNITNDFFSAFNKSAYLKNFMISSVKANYIEPGAFKWFLSLETFMLVQTDLKSAQFKHALDFLSESVTYLDLSNNNKMETVPDKMFSGMVAPHNVRKLNLGRCGLSKQIPIKQLSALTNLEILGLEYNALTGLNRNSIQLFKLSELYLPNNAIKYVPRGIFTTFPNMTLLDMSGNSITYFSTDFKCKCTHNIRTIILKGCHLRTVSNMKQFPMLEKLNLLNNNIEKISSDMFKGVFHLQTLLIDHNGIVYLNRDIFRDLHELRHLSIKQNNIQYIYSTAFKPLLKLDYLSLSHNGIEELNVSVVQHLKSLTYLDFSMNPLQCTCDSLPFNKWLHNNNIYVAGYTLDKTVMCNYKSRRINFFDFNLTDYDCSSISNVIIISASHIGCCLVILLLSLAYRFRWYLRYEYVLLRTKVYRYRAARSQPRYMFDGFVSFSSKDCEWVLNELVEHVETDNDMKLCLYDRNWLGGKKIVDYIVESIDVSKHVVLVVSNAWAKSTWCSDEMHMARFVNPLNVQYFTLCNTEKYQLVIYIELTLSSTTTIDLYRNTMQIVIVKRNIISENICIYCNNNKKRKSHVHIAKKNNCSEKNCSDIFYVSIDHF